MIDFDSLVLGPCEDAFGQPVSYTPSGGGAVPFTLIGVFDRAYLEVTLSSDGAPIQTRMPVLGVRDSAFPAGTIPKQGDLVTVGASNFRVASSEPDSHGHTLLKLTVVRP